ncbi:MAG: hypothetical protein E7313_05490 [Clostridiales bacterium]|nr:hypothetical protein [Clostridiales bacterium]
MRKKIIIIFLFILLFFLLFNNISFAAHPQLISKLNSAFTKIQSWLVSLSTPAAAVAVGTGIFMKKFSFGDDERIRTGKKLIRTALFSYILILLLDLILSTIQNLLIS